MQNTTGLTAGTLDDQVAARLLHQRIVVLGAEVEIELVDAARGVSVSVDFEIAVACATCGGDGVEQLPGRPLERRDHQDVGSRQRGPGRCQGAGIFGQLRRAWHQDHRQHPLRTLGPALRG